MYEAQTANLTETITRQSIYYKAQIAKLEAEAKIYKEAGELIFAELGGKAVELSRELKKANMIIEDQRQYKLLYNELESKVVALSRNLNDANMIIEEQRKKIFSPDKTNNNVVLYKALKLSEERYKQLEECIAKSKGSQHKSTDINKKKEQTRRLKKQAALKQKEEGERLEKEKRENERAATVAKLEKYTSFFSLDILLNAQKLEKEKNIDNAPQNMLEKIKKEIPNFELKLENSFTIVHNNNKHTYYELYFEDRSIHTVARCILFNETNIYVLNRYLYRELITHIEHNNELDIEHHIEHNNELITDIEHHIEHNNELITHIKHKNKFILIKPVDLETEDKLVFNLQFEGISHIQKDEEQMPKLFLEAFQNHDSLQNFLKHRFQLFYKKQMRIDEFEITPITDQKIKILFKKNRSFFIFYSKNNEQYKIFLINNTSYTEFDLPEEIIKELQRITDIKNIEIEYQEKIEKMIDEIKNMIYEFDFPEAIINKLQMNIKNIKKTIKYQKVEKIKDEITKMIEYKKQIENISKFPEESNVLEKQKQTLIAEKKVLEERKQTLIIEKIENMLKSIFPEESNVLEEQKQALIKEMYIEKIENMLKSIFPEESNVSEDQKQALIKEINEAKPQQKALTAINEEHPNRR